MDYDEAIDILKSEVLDYIPSAASWLSALYDLAQIGKLEAVKVVIDVWIEEPEKVLREYFL